MLCLIDFSVLLYFSVLTDVIGLHGARSVK